MVEKVYALLKSLGTTPEEVVLKWVEEGKIDLDRIAELVKQNAQNKSSEVKKAKEVKAGMFLTKNKKICSEYNPDECVAVVLKVFADSREALMLNIVGKKLAFSSGGIDTDTSGFSSLNATHFVKQMAEDAKVAAEAANYCLEFENDFVEKGSAFLLSKEEVESLEYNEDLRKAFDAAKLSDKTFWTVTTPADNLKPDDETYKTAYMFDLRGSKISLHSEYVRLPLDVHPAYVVKLNQIL